MSAKERDDAKTSIKEKLSEERGSADDADIKLGEPYITDNRTEEDMLKEECQQERLPRYKVRTIKLEEVATGTKRLSIPHTNTSGQLKLENYRFMENFYPDPTASAVRPKEVVMRLHPTLANILLTVRSEDTRLPGDPYTIDEEFVRRGDNPGRYVDHVDVSLVEHLGIGTMYSQTPEY